MSLIIYNSATINCKKCCFNFIIRVTFKNRNIKYFGYFYLLQKRFKCLFLHCSINFFLFFICVLHFIKASDGRTNKNFSSEQLLKEFLLSISFPNAQFQNLNNQSQFFAIYSSFQKILICKTFYLDFCFQQKTIWWQKTVLGLVFAILRKEKSEMYYSCFVYHSEII